MLFSYLKVKIALVYSRQQKTLVNYCNKPIGDILLMEARIDFMKQIGWPYEKMEEAGIISPVTAIACKYKASTTFPDEIEINVSIDELKTIILRINYLMRNQDGKTVFEGHSEHCFLSKDGKIIRIDREFPAFFEALQQQK